MFELKLSGIQNIFSSIFLDLLFMLKVREERILHDFIVSIFGLFNLRATRWHKLDIVN